MSQDGLKFWGGAVGNSTLINVSATNPLPVTGGTSTTSSNITQIGSSNITLGQALSAASLPVVMSSDSTMTIAGSVTASGTITLGAGSASVGTVVLGAGTAAVGSLTAGTAIIGKVGIDQTTPGTTNGVQLTAGTAAIGSLTAGTAVIGKVGIDQTTLGTTNAVQIIPGTTGGLSMSSTIIANTTATVVKGSAGQIYGIGIDNNTAGTVYLKIYNATSATAGSGTPALRIMCPGPTNGGGAARDIHQPNGIAFGTGITFIVTQLQADNDTTAVPASSVTVNILYK